MILIFYFRMLLCSDKMYYFANQILIYFILTSMISFKFANSASLYASLSKGLDSIQKFGNKVADQLQEDINKMTEKLSQSICKEKKDSKECKTATQIQTGSQAFMMTGQSEINNSIDALKKCLNKLDKNDTKGCREALKEDFDSKKDLVKNVGDMAGPK